MRKSATFSPAVRERAVRMVQAHRGEHASPRVCIESIVGKIGCTAQTLDNWIKQHECDQGLREGLTSEQAQRLKELERENRERRRANEILTLASALFAQAELDRRLT
jgi:transposase